MKQPFERLVYRSRALWPGPEAALDDILTTALWTNARLGVTGALGFSGGAYVQLLEGSPEALDVLMAKLEADPRHARIEVLLRAPTARRLVPGWSMARVDLAVVAPDVAHRLEAGDGAGLAALLASLVHQGQTSVA